jgi:hypothetical protein
MTSRHWRLGLIALAAFDAAFVLGYVFPALHHPVALAISPVLGVGLAMAVEGWSRRRIVIATGIALVLMLPLMISPTYLGRLF